MVGARHKATATMRSRWDTCSASRCGASTGKTIGTYCREEIAGPLKLDFHIGLDPRHDPAMRRVIAARRRRRGSQTQWRRAIRSPLRGRR